MTLTLVTYLTRCREAALTEAAIFSPLRVSTRSYWVWVGCKLLRPGEKKTQIYIQLV